MNLRNCKPSRGRCSPPGNNNPEPVGTPRSTKLIMDLAPNSDCEKMNKSGAPIAPAQAEGTVAKPKRKRPRLYFARLDPPKDLKKQMASRIIQFLCAESDEDGRVGCMRMYHSLHGNRYRDRNGPYTATASSCRFLPYYCLPTLVAGYCGDPTLWLWCS